MNKAFSVRTYNAMMRLNVWPHNPAEAVQIGDRMAAGEFRNVRIRGAIELYRAAGLGVYQIYYRLNGCRPVETIREVCARCDREFYR